MQCFYIKCSKIDKLFLTCLNGKDICDQNKDELNMWIKERNRESYMWRQNNQHFNLKDNGYVKNGTCIN